MKGNVEIIFPVTISLTRPFSGFTSHTHTLNGTVLGSFTLFMITDDEEREHPKHFYVTIKTDLSSFPQLYAVNSCGKEKISVLTVT